MTMLYSLYTAEGIAYAADSRVVRPPSERQPRQRKVLTVPRLGVADESGVIGWFGLAEVRRRPMDQWLRAVIDHWPGSADVGKFASHLIERLRERTAREELDVSGFHIGAFEERDGVVVPVFYFVRNMFKLNDDGTYGDIRNCYEPEEQLLGRDCKRLLGDPPMAEVKEALRRFQIERGLPVWYRNGDLPRFTPICDGLISRA